MFSRRKPTTPVIETKTLPIPRRMLALEPRYVFDAALATELHDAATTSIAADHGVTDSHDTGAAIVAAAHDLETQARAHGTANDTAKDPAGDRAIQDLVAAHNLGPSNHEIAFIDSRLADIGTLVSSVPPGTRIVLIDGARDGVAQMVDALRGEQGITGIHILSHGSAGHLELGASTIDAQTMSTIYRSALSSIHGNLADGADILVYGCDFGAGEGGARATQMLAELTGADVASSEDLTGSEARGGDWVLERHVGDIEARTLTVQEWKGVLAALNISTTAQPILSGSGVGQTALWTNAGTVGADSIDLRATVLSVAGAATTAVFSTTTTSGQDDPSILIVTGATSPSPTGSVTVRWEVFRAGTNQTVVANGDPTFGIADIDGVSDTGAPTRESVTASKVGLVAYTLNTPTDLRVDASGSTVEVWGTFNDVPATSATTKLEYSWVDVQFWDVTYTLTSNNVTFQARFNHDGDGDLVFASPVTTYLAPNAVDDTFSTNQGTAATINVRSNDSDPQGETFEVTDVNGTAIAIGDPGVAVTGGVVTLDVSGNLVFTPTPGFTGATSFTYTITDQYGAPATATVTGDVNGRPTLTDPDAGATTPYINPADPANLIVPAVDNTAVAVDLDSYYTDPEGNALTFTPNMTGAPAWLTYNPVTHVLSGTPPVDNTGPVTVPVSVTDSHGNTFASTVTISPVNPGPTAVTDTQGTAAGTPVTLTLLANDTDPDGDPLSVTTASVPAAQGTVALVGGNWVFTPAGGFTGTATISYTIQDQDGATSSSTHTVVVTANDPPVLTDPDAGPTTPYINPADPASLIVPATDGSPVSVDLDTYYADPNGDPMTFTPNMTGAPAWLTYNPVTHVLSGTPPVDNVGPVTVPVSVTDGHGNTFASTITFSPVNPGPTAVTDTQETAAGTPVTLTLLANDTDPDGDPLSVTTASVPAAQGTVALVGGNWVFTPAPGFVGTATISYTIQDQDGATSSSTHTVTVNAPPALTDPDVGPTTPFINPADPANLIVPATDGSPVSVDLDTYYADPNGDPMTFTPNMTGAPAWLTYNPVTHVLSGTPPVDNVGPVTVPVSVTDGHGNTFASTITFSPVNPGPTAVTDTQETAAGTPVTLTLLANDTDPDGDPLSVTTASVPAAQGTVALVGGNWVFTPAPGFTGTATISYTIQDQDGATSSSTHTVTVNAPPALTDPDVGPTTPYINPADPANLIVPATDGSPVSVDLDTYYADPNGDPMTFTPNMTGAPAWLTYNPVTHVLSGTPPADNVGPVTVPVSVTDGHGNTFASTITFSPVNPGPTAVTDTQETAAGTPVTLTLLANDTDPDGDPLSVTTASVPAAQGTVALVGGNWVFTPAPGFTGTATISYTIQDQDGATSSSTHTVAVNAPPALTDPDVGPTTPYINPADPANLIVPATDGSPASVDLDTYYADPNGDPMTYTPNMTGAPAWLTYNPVTHVLSGTPPVDNVGPVTVPVSVTDGHGNTFASTITFSPVNPGPTAVTDTQETAAGTPVTLTLLANDTDPDGDPLSVTTASVPAAQGNVALVGGNWVFTPAPGFTGNATISYTIQDQDGATSSSTHTVAVNAPPALTDPDVGPTTPYINPADPANLIVPATDGSPVSVDLDTYYADPNGDPMTYTPNMTGAPAWLTYNPVTHVLSGTPPVDNVGPVTVPVSVTDGHGNTFASTITFSPVNPGPTAVTDTQETAAGTPVTLTLLANDTDPDGDPLSVTTASVPAAQGTVALVGGNWVFTPAPGFVGTATISYTIQDQDSATSSSTHTVTVNAPPALTDPDVGPTTPYINPADPANLIVPATDGSPVSVDLDTYYADPNGDPMTFTPNMTGAPAWLTYNPVTHVLSGTPPVDNVGPVTVPVSVTDGHGNTFASTITFSPVNPGPTAVTDTATTGYISPVIVDLLVNDTDPDGDPLTVTSATLANPAQGTLTQDPVTHVWTFTPAAGFTGTATINYTMQDQDGATSSSTHTVTVTPPALAARDDAYTTGYTTALNGNAANADVYAAGSTFAAATTPAHGTVVMNADGTFVYTPVAGFAGTDTFTYRITDPAGQTVVATETITVTPPTLTAVDDSYTTPFRTTLNASAAAGDTFAAGSTFVATSTPAQGTLTMRSDGTYTYVPPTNFAGTVTFTYRITDPVGQTRTATETITVSRPALTAIDHANTTAANRPLVSNASRGDTFASGSTFRASSSPAHGTVTMRTDGTYTYAPAKNWYGTDTFTYTITDPTGQVVTATETITVTAPPPLQRCLTTFAKLTGFRRR